MNLNMSEHPRYWQDPLKDRFDVTIESIVEVNGHTFVKIHEPVIKPSGGGQAGDRGFIQVNGNTFEFIDTVLVDDEPKLLMKTTPRHAISITRTDFPPFRRHHEKKVSENGSW